ncbi:MAG: hypothetical protein O7J95_20040, partial [Planctomycetota bacterium]|nr:hypothetical protein [Planctomycetota bacterium]
MQKYSGMMMKRVVSVVLVVVFQGSEGVAPAAEVLEGRTLFVCDSAADRVMRFTDLDGSGAIEPGAPGEIVVYYDASGGGPELSVPSHLAVGGDEELYLLDGGTLDAILVLADANGDGDAADPGEARVFYDRSAFGPRLSTPNTLLVLPDGSLYVSDDGSRARRILRLEDTNGDGDALDEGEAVVVFDPSSLADVVPEDLESLAVLPDG